MDWAKKLKAHFALSKEDREKKVEEAAMLLFRHVKYFSQENFSIAVLFARHGNIERFEAQQVVFDAGDAPSKFYIILEGQIEVMEGDANSVSILSIFAGESFGELALLNNSTRSATLMCYEFATLLTLDRNRYLKSVTAESVLKKAGWAISLSKAFEKESRDRTEQDIDLIHTSMRAIKAFSILKRESQRAICKTVEKIEFKDGELIFDKGETTEFVCGVLTGEYEVRDAKGEVIECIRNGDMFGNEGEDVMAPRKTSVVCTRGGTALKITIRNYLTFIAGVRNQLSARLWVHRLLPSIPREKEEIVAKFLKIQIVKAGESIVYQGQPLNVIGFIRSGECSLVIDLPCVSKREASASELGAFFDQTSQTQNVRFTVANLDQGDCIGALEYFALPNRWKTYMCTAIATTKVELYFIKTTEFHLQCPGELRKEVYGISLMLWDRVHAGLNSELHRVATEARLAPAGPFLVASPVPNHPQHTHNGRYQLEQISSRVTNLQKLFLKRTIPAFEAPPGMFNIMWGKALRNDMSKVRALVVPEHRSTQVVKPKKRPSLPLPPASWLFDQSGKRWLSEADPTYRFQSPRSSDSPPSRADQQPQQNSHSLDLEIGALRAPLTDRRGRSDHDGLQSKSQSPQSTSFSRDISSELRPMPPLLPRSIDLWDPFPNPQQLPKVGVSKPQFSPRTKHIKMLVK